MTGVVTRCPLPECGAVITDAQEPQEPTAPTAEAKAPKRSRTGSQDAPGPVNVLKLAKARRSYLVKEVRRLKRELKAAEKEEAQLSRLLNAADDKPTKVRRLTVAGI